MEQTKEPQNAYFVDCPICREPTRWERMGSKRFECVVCHSTAERSELDRWNPRPALI